MELMSTVHTNIFKVLSEPRRRRILSVLEGNEFSVQELQRILNLGQSIISAHLAHLKHNNLVHTRRNGKYILYRLNSKESFYANILQVTLSITKNEEWYQRDIQQAQKILQIKKEASLSFYEGLESQNKRSPGQTDHSLAIAFMRSIHNKRIVDIGCGSGKLAKEFSLRNTVLGIDINDKQIKMAKKLYSTEIHNKHLDFKTGSAEKLELPDNSQDIIIFSHSLHHIEKPSIALNECYRVLSSKGLLLILDLHKHNEIWLKDSLGDIHLGFNRDTIERWLHEAYFTHISIDIDVSDVEYPDFETLIICAEKE